MSLEQRPQHAGCLAVRSSRCNFPVKVTAWTLVSLPERVVAFALEFVQ